MKDGAAQGRINHLGGQVGARFVTTKHTWILLSSGLARIAWAMKALSSRPTDALTAHDF